MKKVLVFGTFDIFHEGHKHFLRQAKTYGDFLRVVVARDATVEKVKKKRAYNNEEQRKKIIEESGLADEVVLGNSKDKFSVVKEYGPDVICLGYDQRFFVDALEEKLNKFGLGDTVIIRIGSFEPEKYKSSLLRSKME